MKMIWGAHYGVGGGADGEIRCHTQRTGSEGLSLTPGFWLPGVSGLLQPVYTAQLRASPQPHPDPRLPHELTPKREILPESTDTFSPAPATAARDSAGDPGHREPPRH